MSSSVKANEICCPEFDPSPWDGKSFEWTDKKFIREKVSTFFFIPLNFGRKMKKLDQQVRNAGGTVSGNLCLSEHTSKWNMDLYLAVENEIHSAANVSLSGMYYSKVYEGPFGNTGKWTKDFQSLVKLNGQKIRKLYMWYTTCPKCAKKYGKNYTVLISQVE